jgi:hypothetical protein
MKVFEYHFKASKSCSTGLPRNLLRPVGKRGHLQFTGGGTPLWVIRVTVRFKHKRNEPIEVCTWEQGTVDELASPKIERAILPSHDRLRVPGVGARSGEIQRRHHMGPILVTYSALLEVTFTYFGLNTDHTSQVAITEARCIWPEVPNPEGARTGRHCERR